MIWVVLFAVAAMCAWPFVQEARKPEATPEVRGVGALAQLSQGRTWYRWYGPARGPVVVAIHGLTTPSPVFDDLASRLAQPGYRVLVYDLYGRGLSDAAAGLQNGTFFLRQVDDLLDDQGVDTPVTFVGYSMGGTIATLFAARSPERVERVVLLAPAGLGLNLTPFWRTARGTPLFGDWLVRGFGAQQLRRAAAMGSAIGQTQRDQPNRRGYLPAVLSSLRGILGQTIALAHRKVASAGIPVLGIWSGRDQTIPASAIGELARWNRDAVQEVIPDADHSLPWQHADVAADIILNWIADQPVVAKSTVSDETSGAPTTV